MCMTKHSVRDMSVWRKQLLRRGQTYCSLPEIDYRHFVCCFLVRCTFMLHLFRCSSLWPKIRKLLCLVEIESSCPEPTLASPRLNLSAENLLWEGFVSWLCKLFKPVKLHKSNCPAWEGATLYHIQLFLSQCLNVRNFKGTEAKGGSGWGGKVYVVILHAVNTHLHKSL